MLNIVTARDDYLVIRSGGITSAPSLPPPKQLFDALVKPPGGRVNKLWGHQEEVLDRYSASLTEKREIAIELPTGSGKTLIGLLILEWWRRQGKKAALLTSSKALAEDVRCKAAEVGIPSVVITGRYGLPEAEQVARSRDLRSYKRSGAIAVMNYWAYLYGDFLAPDVLVIDDAHSFQDAAQDLFTVEITRDEHPTFFPQVLTQLRQKHPIYQKLESLERGATSPDTYEAIYLPHLVECVPSIQAHFRERQARGNKDFEAVRNLERLNTYLMFIDRAQITLTPGVAPIEVEEKLRAVKHLIFMSATLGSSELFHRSVGASTQINFLRDSDLKHPVRTMGKRLIFPLRVDLSDGQVDSRAFHAVEQILTHFDKAIVFATSKAQRQSITDFLVSKGLPVFHYNQDSDAQNFASQRKGVLVTAGRYVGLDLSSKVCNVGILLRVPFSINPLDSFTRDQLGFVETSNQRVAQRLVQAFGRCNRSLDDRAIYFVLDGRLEAEIDGEERLTQFFPREVLAQMELGYDLSGRTLDGAIGVGEDFLGEKIPDYDRQLGDILTRQALGGESPWQVSKTTLGEVKGWTELVQRRSYYDAGEIFKFCQTEAEKSGKDGNPTTQAAWYAYMAAMSHFLQYHFQSGGDPSKVACLEALDDSMRLGQLSWFNAIRTISNELRNVVTPPAVLFESVELAFGERVLRLWERFRIENTKKGGKVTPTLAIENLRQGLVKGNHQRVVDATEELFTIAGFEVRNTSRENGECDLQLFANDTSPAYMIAVEVKTIDQSPALSKTDVDQAKGRVEHYRTKFGATGMEVFPLIVSNKPSIDTLAIEEAHKSCRLLGADGSLQLLSGYSRLMEGSWRLPSSPVSRVAFLKNVPTLAALQRILRPSDEPRVSIAELAGLFPPA